MSEQPDASEQPGYSAPAKWLHWLIAPIVLAMIPVGAIMGDLPHGALQDRLFFLHESFGLTVLALMVARIASAAARRAAAGALADARRAHDLRRDASCDVSAAGSDARARLAGALGLWPASRLLRAVRAAGLARQGRAAVKAAVLRAWRRGFSLAALIALHLLGVARHVFVKRDRLVWRMLPGRN